MPTSSSLQPSPSTRAVVSPILSFLAGASLAVAYIAVSAFSPPVGESECVCRCVAEACPAPAEPAQAAVPSEDPAATADVTATIEDATTETPASALGKRFSPVRQSESRPELKHREHIRSVVRAHISEVRECYNAALSTDPETAGRVEVRFEIAPDGSVPTSEVASDTTGAAGLADCIAGAITGWSFPPPGHHAPVVVTYPFVLEPG